MKYEMCGVHTVLNGMKRDAMHPQMGLSLHACPNGYVAENRGMSPRSRIHNHDIDNGAYEEDRLCKYVSVKKGSSPATEKGPNPVPAPAQSQQTIQRCIPTRKITQMFGWGYAINLL